LPVVPPLAPAAPAAPGGGPGRGRRGYPRRLEGRRDPRPPPRATRGRAAARDLVGGVTRFCHFLSVRAGGSVTAVLNDVIQLCNQFMVLSVSLGIGGGGFPFFPLATYAASLGVGKEGVRMISDSMYLMSGVLGYLMAS